MYLHVVIIIDARFKTHGREYISCAIALAEVPGHEDHISDSMFEISVKVCILACCCK